MARVPFIGRLFWREYVALVGSMILIFLEGLITIITLGLPQPIIRFCYKRSKHLFNALSSSKGSRSRPERSSFSTAIANASDFVDLCTLFGYYAEEHIVQTGDGYLLGLHRLGWRQGEEGVRVNAGEGSITKRVVYLHHGLLMNSEVWVCMTEKERCLPFMLVEKGYDVWLGNNRGNKYSKKSTLHSPTSNEFWNFSMDQFAFHDIPDSIDYILNTTAQPSLSYIGFSQGTAQAFATLSIHPTLNDKIDVFIALAPAMSPAGLYNGVVNALMKASPEVVFLAFGRKSLLSSTTMWQSILYPPIFVNIIDASLSFLFNWTAKNISPEQKLAAYPHLYSFTSTKSIVHWFQIIRNKSFQMYDDDVQVSLSLGAVDRYYKVPKFPTRNIKTPVFLLWGGSDSLVDINIMLKELPRHTVAREVRHFEHLDFLWAREVGTLVFPHVFEALEAYAGRDHLKQRSLTYSLLRNKRLTIEQPHSSSEEEVFSVTVSDAEQETNDTTSGGYGSAEDRAHTSPSHLSHRKATFSPQPTSIPAPISQFRVEAGDDRSTSPKPNHYDYPVGSNTKKHRSGSIPSVSSVESIKRFGQGGISVGPARPTVATGNSPGFVRVHDEGSGRRKAS